MAGFTSSHICHRFHRFHHGCSNREHPAASAPPLEVTHAKSPPPGPPPLADLQDVAHGTVGELIPRQIDLIVAVVLDRERTSVAGSQPAILRPPFKLLVAFSSTIQRRVTWCPGKEGGPREGVAAKKLGSAQKIVTPGEKTHMDPHGT